VLPDEIILATNFNVKSVESKEADLNDPQNDMEYIEIMIKFIKPTPRLVKANSDLEKLRPILFSAK